MSAISYQITLGQTLEQVTVSTNPPALPGAIEIRMDTTTTSITDAQSPGGTRALKRGEIYTLLKILQEKVSVDPNLPQ